MSEETLKQILDRLKAIESNKQWFTCTEAASYLSVSATLPINRPGHAVIGRALFEYFNSPNSRFNN